jgi:SnoaL-like domain
VSTSSIDDLLAKDAITQVIHRVARGTDRLDHDLIVSGYWPDGFDDHNSFRGGPVEFADWVLTVLPHFSITHHFLGQCRIEIDGDVAHTETYCNAHHVAHPDDNGQVTDMAMGLRYVDRFERRDGEWRIAKRICAFDWAYTTGGPVWPFPDDFTVGHRDRSDITYDKF